MSGNVIAFSLGLFLCTHATLGQSIFKKCDKNTYALSSPESWQRDTLTSKTYICNCCSSTTYIVLYHDSTFQYKVGGEGPGGYAEGKWILKANSEIALVGRKSDRKLISVHGHDFSWSYEIVDVSHLTFVIGRDKLTLKH